MARLLFLEATKRLALCGVLLFGAFSTAATASSWIVTSGSSSAAGTGRVTSVTRLTVSPSSVDHGQTVTFTATLKFGLDFAPAGTRVRFAVDRTFIASSTTTANGVATFSTSALAGGRHVVLASYLGSNTVSPSHDAKRIVVGCPITRPSGECESLLANPRPAVGTTLHPGQTLTIVAMNDGPLGTSGALAPTAVLSTGQSLVVTTKPTSGRRPGYVDTNGGSIGTTNQLLLSFTLPSGLAAGRYTILVTAYDLNGDSDQWYWPIKVAGTQLPYTIGGSITELLYPGRSPSPINLSFANPNPAGSGAAGVRVGKITVKISAVSASAATPLRPCTPADFAVTQFAGTYPFEIPHGNSTLQSLGFAAEIWPTVRLVDRPVNQDGCKGATITISYRGSP